MAGPNDGVDIGTVLQWVLNVLGALVTMLVGFMVQWLRRMDTKIEDFRREAQKIAEDGDADLEKAIEKLSETVIDAITEHREDFKDWQQRQGARWEELARWRENMIAITPTRNQIDKKLDEVVERLDTRINPLLDASRKRLGRRTSEE